MVVSSVFLVEARYIAIAVAFETLLYFNIGVVEFVYKDLGLLEEPVPIKFLGRR